jgi:hypothetical protein
MLTTGCGDDDANFNPNQAASGNCTFEGDWLIPSASIFDGGPGCDGIPSIDAPVFVSLNEATYLEEDDLLLAIDNGGGNVKLYAHNVLDWHEIINDQTADKSLAIVYCPLTGTGIGWDRMVDGEPTTFGVSGLLYNTNIIPYDRKTGSNWSQQQMQCVNGVRAGERPVTTNLLEVRWSDAKVLFPDAIVTSDRTGFSRNYTAYPYGDYRTNDDNIIFPVANDDDRLNNKERVLGVIEGEEAKAYRFESFTSNRFTMIEDEFAGRQLVVVGSRSPEMMNIFDRQQADGTVLDLTLATTGGTNVLTDQEGNVWNILGLAVSGPRTGEKLASPTAMMGYWFSWGAFYPGLEIYGE